MKRNILFYVFLSFVGLGISNPTVAEGKKLKLLTLKDAVFLSLRYNPNIISAEIQRVVDKFTVAVAKNQFEVQYALTGSAVQTNSVAGGNPLNKSGAFSLNPSVSRQSVYGTKYQLAMADNITTTFVQTPHAFTREFNPSMTLTVTQPLMQGSGREVTEAPLFTALNADDIAKLNLKSTVMTSITQVMTDYWNTVGSESSLIIAQNALKSSRDTVKQNTLQIQLGFMAPSENVQAELAVSNQEIQVISSQFAVMQAKLTLLMDMGLAPDTTFEIEKHLNIDSMTYPKGKEAEAILLKTNPSYLISLLTLQNTKIALLQGEDQQRWTLDFVATVVQGGGSGGGQNAGWSSLYNGFNRSRELALALTIPIDNLTTQEAFVSAKVGFNQQQLSTQALKLSLVTQRILDEENLKVLRLQVDLAKKSEALAYKSYQDALKKVFYGQSSMFEVTSLQTDYINASLGVVSAEISYVNGIIAYKQSLGTTLDIWKINLAY